MTVVLTRRNSAIGGALGSLLKNTPSTFARPLNLSTSEFNAACAANAVDAVYVQESTSGFGLFLRLRNDPSIRVITTPNQHQRKWSNLNSLVTFLHRHNTPVGELTIRLNKSAVHQ
jgi:hypothetical protein